eukprot:CAMPEP_0181285352 /NCGR_PEP_ID=MMETSP1097-20121128/15945_1 /TAXON_ID=35684 /ORGANISM="Pseudopedinella elastica, Strain CCMP716" /LENGTH=34 /DNA_ID= /DNA_START= /DNA_END= /DNA_ORIENTATION=
MSFRKADSVTCPDRRFGGAADCSEGAAPLLTAVK